MRMVKADFEIRKDKEKSALALLKGFAASEGYLLNVDMDDLMQAETLIDALYECRYAAEANSDGNITIKNFYGYKLRDDEEIFNAIAPVVIENSYIEMRGGGWQVVAMGF